jgi:hypothetical protein
MAELAGWRLGMNSSSSRLGRQHPGLAASTGPVLSALSRWSIPDWLSKGQTPLARRQQ